MNAIKTSGLSKSFGEQTAVDGLSIEVERGGVVGFVGPNGAGKTTTIRMLLGLVRPTGGTAEVLGVPIQRPEHYLPRVGSLIESPAFYPNLTGRQNLVCLARLGGHAEARVADLLRFVGLAERGDTAYRSYSLGMKQRLAIAAALLPDPELVILDEPTNGLDPAGIHEVRDLLRKLGDEGRTVFVSSHILAEIQRMCDRVIVMRRGRAIFQGTVAELVARQEGITVAARDASQHARLVEMCVASGHDARVDGGTVHVDAPVEWAADLNELAMRAGIVLREIRPIVRDLEETFLEMTGGETTL